MTDYRLPEFPEQPDGVTLDDIEAAAEKATDPNAPDATLPVKHAAAVYVKECNAHLAWRPEPSSGIAVHKLGSNDGWLVTPEEIDAALANYRMCSGEEVKTVLTSESDDGDVPISYWIEWIAYLERAKARGGFEVY